MLSLLLPKILLVLLLASLAGGGVQTWRLDALKREIAEERAAKIAAALAYSENARQAEAAAGKRIKGIQDAKDADLRRVAGVLGSALDELQQRADRAVPGAAGETRATCAGATGAELARPDASFLARYAALAESFRRELAACQLRERTEPVMPAAKE